MSEVRILQFGETGQVSRELLARAPGADVKIRALSRADVDLADADGLRRALKGAAADIDLVINAAAYTAVDAAESDEAAAMAVNGAAPGIMAEICKALGLGFIHLSTDYVFDGSGSGAYTEDDPVSPLGAYGRSKRAGEEAVLRAHPGAIIIRTAWVFSPWGKNFLKTMVRLARERDTLSVVADQHGCPTPAGEIANAVLTLAAALHGGAAGGVYHYTGGEPTTWHGFAQTIFQHMEALGEPIPAVNAITTAEFPTPAARPANSVLDCSKLKADFAIEPADWRAGLARDLGKVLTGRKRT